MSTILSEISRNRQVKDYICLHFCEEPKEIEAARLRAENEGLKSIHVPANVGKALSMLARLVRPTKILEIGTLGGYSTLWLARELGPEGKLITLECQKKHAEVAKKNFIFANMEDKIEIRLGLAANLLKQLIEERAGPFDLIFLDADKENYPHYIEPCLELSKKGTLILSDNLIPKRGELGVPALTDIEAVGIYTFNQKIASHPRLDSTLFPTIVGEKGCIDSLGISIVK
jgi:predicted O-methyltransferase YrrM